MNSHMYADTIYHKPREQGLSVKQKSSHLHLVQFNVNSVFHKAVPKQKLRKIFLHAFLKMAWIIWTYSAGPVEGFEPKVTEKDNEHKKTRLML